MSFHFVLNSSQWLAIFLAFCPYGGTTILKRKCGVEEAVKKRPDKASAPYVPQFERLLMKNAIQRHDLDAYSDLGNSNIQCKEQYLVPIAWHVIQNSEGRGNVSDVQLETQIRVLNEAFSKTPFRFKTHSVDRTTNDVWFNRCKEERFKMRPALAISPATTLNVYTCQFRGPLLGDYTFPWFDHESDVIHAVAIHHETLPNGRMATYNLGHILVHQIGHFFGLYDVCEGGCDREDDEVADTPRCRHYTHVCTDEKLDTCKAQSGLDPINNYMSDMEDNCTREFSPGQIDKMLRDVKRYKPTLMENIYRPCRIDAAFRWSNGFVYLFLGSRYYRYNETRHGIDPGYPRPIRDHWNGIPSSIDGVFRYVNGITYFFKGNQYYRFNDSSLSVDSGYPRPISNFWLGVPDDIDDVIDYSNGYTYFFKGTKYYRFNPNCLRVDPGYPRQLSSYWNGFPNDIESALTWYNGGVYVFKDTQTWFFLHSSDSIGILSSYPESVTKWWNDDPNISGYAAFRHVNGSMFFFKGDKYWSYNEQINQVNPGYPRTLAAWGGVPVDVDAAFVWTDGYAYFFKDDIYFRYNNATQRVQDGYPRNISSFWKGVPNNVSAVFRYTDDITYFFKDSFYYRFNDSLQAVDPGYPQPITSFWKGIPDNLDTVFKSGSGLVFFFKQNLFYRFNQIARQVEAGYPKSIALWKGILYQP